MRSALLAQHGRLTLLAVAALLCAACSDEGDAPEAAGGAGGATGTSSSASGGGGADQGGGGADQGGGGAARVQIPAACPIDMVFIGGACMDRYEAPNVAGASPLVMESAVSAAAWCADRGKRLCTEDEWDAACAGPSAYVYPYGDTYELERCNDNKTWIAPDEPTLNTWPSSEAQAEVDALYQAAPSGAYGGCVSDYGVHDLTGNVEEWVIRTQPHANNYPHVLKGCYWSGCYGGSKPKCSSTNPAHADGFRFYETGFRCCLDAP